MLTDYHYQVDESQLRDFAHSGHWNEAFDMLAQPLHEALYKAGTFDWLDSLSPTERLILSFDYVQTQVEQGGFIQLIQNGYVSLLVTVIEALQALHIETEIAFILDDVLKVFVLNKDQLGRATTVEEFGGLYKEFKEFELLEEKFNQERDELLNNLIQIILPDI